MRVLGSYLPSLPEGVSRRYAILSLLLLATIWLWIAFDRPYKFPEHISWNPYANTPQSLNPSADGPDAFDFPPLDSESVRSVCTDTIWNSSIIFTCNNSVGGIGNIRNSILNCVRYAIAAGASLVEPQIVLRDTSDTSVIRTGNLTSMSYMFSVSHFYDSLRLSCPGLIIYDSLDAVSGSLHAPLHLDPESLESDSVPASGLVHPERWPQLFHDFLAQHLSLADSSIAVVDLQRSYLHYPVHTDGAGFALEFGSILKFRRDTRLLATKTILALGAKLNYPIGDASENFYRNFFMGVHLRTEHDAQLGWPYHDWIWGRFETQSKLYLEQAEKNELRQIYVASGDQAEILKFAANASTIGAKVHTKHTILDAASVATLDALAWDQQGMVDFLVMLKSSDFAGVGHSSFAWNIALRRHQWAEKEDYLSGPHHLDDQLSTIYGFPNQYPEYANCMWIK